jgi:hypothetical protein
VWGVHPDPSRPVGRLPWFRRIRTLSVIRFRLFITSYAPLLAIFSARYAAANDWIFAILFAIMAAIAVFDGYRLISSVSNRAKRDASATDVRDQGAAVSGYLATYLLPFIADLPENWGDWLAYALYFVVALIVFVRSDMAMVNPTFYVLGRQIARATVDGRDVLLISRTALKSGDDIRVSGFFDVLVVDDSPV